MNKIGLATLAAIAGFAIACSTVSSDEQNATPAPAGNPNGADVGGACESANDCKSGICTNGACQPAPARDGARDGDEMDIDCGGSSSPKCGDGKTCLVAEDCASSICEAGKCKAPSPTDGVKNGKETDVDCGGAGAPRCADGLKCSAAGDCSSSVCEDGACISPAANDGVKNGKETDVDCGGVEAGTPRCATGKTCALGPDCESQVCDPGTKKCKAPTGTDGFMNGDESDVDCGGTTTGAPRCTTSNSCKVHGDCASDGCDYNGKCALRKSCTRRYGGDTCGAGETGEPGAQHESCCTTISFSQGGKNVSLDKYDITAGRMRAFVERTNGNLRSAMTGAASFPQSWLSYLPQDLDQVNARLGPAEVFEEAPRIQGQRMVDGCYIAGQGTRTWWAPASAGDPTKMGRDQLDEKALNCVNLPMLYALCAWEGGRLPTVAEYQAAWRGTDNRRYPWGNTSQDSRMVHGFNYYFPYTNAAGQACNVGGNCDNSVFIGAPGRRPTGYGPYGHADLAGLVFNMVWDGDYLGRWVWTGSWEDHDPTVGGRTEDLGARPRYWATGGRCAR